MPEETRNEQNGTHISETDRVLAWTKDVAESTANIVPKPMLQARQPEARHVEREPSKMIVNQIITTPAVVVTRTRSKSPPQDKISTKAVIGTVLGATAGAIVAYAMTKSQNETSHVEQPKRVSHRIIETPVTYQIVGQLNENDMREHHWASSSPSHHVTASQLLPPQQIDDVTPLSERSHHSSHPVTRSHVESVTSLPNITKVSVAESRGSRVSHAPSREKTARQSDFIPITEARSAKDVPLPDSRVTSIVTEGRDTNKVDKCSVSPDESVSQVSTRRSGGRGRSQRDSRHGGGTEKDQGHGDHRSRTSRK